MFRIASRHYIWVALIALLVGALHHNPPPAAAQADLRFAVTPAFEGNYTPGTWLPLYVELANTGPPLNATLIASVPGQAGRYSQDIDLPQGSAKATTLYVALEQASRLVQVQVTAAGTVLTQTSIDVQPHAGARMMGIVSDQAIALNLPRRQDVQALPFVVVPLPLEQIPAQARGLGSLSLLLLHDAPLARLDATQRTTLLAWVNNGGHLVVGGGPENRQMVAALPEPLRLAEIGASRTLTPALPELPDTSDAPPEIPGSLLRAAPDVRHFGPPAAPLLLQRTVGDGRVTQLAFNPNLRALNTWPAAPQFWNQLLLPPTLTIATDNTDVQTTRDRLQESALAGTLGYLPTINLPNEVPLLVLLLTYLALVGPLLAVLLRRLRREFWTWWIVPLLALVVGGGALWLAFELRADRRLASAATLVEQIDAETARARTALGILSPNDERLLMQMPADALVRPLRNKQTLAGQLSGATGHYPQQASRMQLPIDRWTFQGILADATLPVAAPTARIVLSDGSMQAQVTNTTDLPLRDTLVVAGDYLALLGDIAAGEQASGPLIQRLSSEAASPDLLSDAQQQLLDAALIPNTRQPNRIQPLLLAWLPDTPLPLHLDAQGIARGQHTLLAAPVALHGQGTFALPAGWLYPDMAWLHGALPCMVQGSIRGVLPQDDTLLLRLVVPQDLAHMQIGDLILTLEGARALDPAAFTVELYDWTAERWQPGAPFSGEPLAEPERYTHRGTLLLRLSGDLSRSGCLLVGGQVAGRIE